MTLDEAIAHAREKAKEQRYYAHFEKSNLMRQSCLKCAEEHEQLAEWLEELKSYRTSVFSGDMTKAMLKEQYCKAIDDLSENLCCAFSENSTKGECEGFTCDILTLDSVSDLVISVSEQLRQQN